MRQPVEAKGKVVCPLLRCLHMTHERAQMNAQTFGGWLADWRSRSVALDERATMKVKGKEVLSALEVRAARDCEHNGGSGR